MEQRIVQNGKIALEDRKFVVDSEIKEEFLSTLVTGTAKTMRGLLFKVDTYEQMIGKSLYDFNFEELDDFIESSFTNKSITSVRSNISYMRKYVNYCIDKNLVQHHENRLMAITNPQKYVDNNAMKNKYIVKSQLQAIIDTLVNPCDKLLIELLFIGVKPSEIRNLEDKYVDLENNRLTLEDDNGNYRMMMNLSEQTMQLLKATINQRMYLLNNGTNKSRKRQDLKVGRGLGERQFEFPQSCYVFKISMSEIPNTKIRKSMIAERIRVIREWVGMNFLTPTSINQSGMIDYAYRLMQNKKCELDKEDYIQICETFQYGKAKINKDGTFDYGSNVWKAKELIQDGFKYLKLYLK